jgi:hypothetical protein
MEVWGTGGIGRVGHGRLLEILEFTGVVWFLKMVDYCIEKKSALRHTAPPSLEGAMPTS